MQGLFDKIRCVGCKVTYMTSLEGAMKSFCPHCRGEYGIRDDKDAEDVLQMIDLGVMQDTHQPHKQSMISRVRDRITGKFIPLPKVDPVAVADGLRAMTDHKIAPVATYEKPITYVTYKNGLFEVRHSDLATVTTKPKEVLGIVEDGKEGMQLNIPKIPLEFLKKTVSFFRGVCARQNGSSEALVQVWWDREQAVHLLHVPEQNVSGGGVHHHSTFDNGAEGRWLHVADIHSHGSLMNAFWSKTDDADEQRVSTERLFGVIGNVTQPVPEWCWRMRTRGGFIDLAVTDIFEIPKETYAFNVSAESLFLALAAPGAYKDGRVNVWCSIDAFNDVEVPEEWYGRVKGYTQQQGHTGMLYGREQQYPAILKGYIYIQDKEYEVVGDNLIATGHMLRKRGEEHGKRN